MNRRNFLKAALGATVAAVVLPEIVAEAIPAGTPLAELAPGGIWISQGYGGHHNPMLFDLCDSNGNVKQTFRANIDVLRQPRTWDAVRSYTAPDVIRPRKTIPLHRPRK